MARPVPSPPIRPKMLRNVIAGHALFYLLLAVGAVRLFAADLAARRTTAAVVVAVVLGLWYTAGILLRRSDRSPRVAMEWLGGLAGLWLVLSLLAVGFVWLAFPLFFLAVFLLPDRTGLMAVTAITITAVVALYLDDRLLESAEVLGPVIGAVAAVALALGYQALSRENEQRRRLLNELERTRASLAESERAAGVLDERQRLAGEIHDTIAQGLSSILMLLQAADGVMDTDLDSARLHLRQAQGTARDNLGEARRFVHALTPPHLDEATLSEALRRLCDSTAAEIGIAVHFHQAGASRPVPTHHEVILFRIAQSALANVRAHAQATRADLTLTHHPDRLALDVYDNGRGANPASLDDTGFGIPTMRRRLETVGGTLVIETAPGQGVAIAATIPAEEAE